MLKWSKYDELGAVALKGNNGKSPVNVAYTTDGSVDVNTVGVYYITYTSGEGINQVSVTRKIVIEDNRVYLISLCVFILVGETIILLRLFVKKRKNDSI